MFFRNKSAGVQWVIAGLGNPGKKYAATRHNIGFDALDFAAERWGIEVRKSKFDALTGTGSVAGQSVLLIKPQTFMNLSGTSLVKACDYYKVPAERLLVLFDDISLAPGMLRIRLNGSAGGHNGLKSIITFLGQDFPRVKIGVGEKPHPDYDLAAWVTGRFSASERKAVEERFGDIAAACELLVQNKSNEAMGLYNGNGRPW